MSEHLCHADFCNVKTPPSRLMCLKHWRKVPVVLRHLVWETYRPGQEVDKQPSDEYLLAAEKAICAVSVKEGHITQEAADLRIAAFTPKSSP